MSKMRPNGITVPSADQYARQMVNAIGLSTVMTGYWFHEIIWSITDLLPRSFTISQARKMMDSTRRRFERKQQQKKD